MRPAATSAWRGWGALASGAPLDHIASLAALVSELEGWRRSAAAFLAGSLSVLAMAPVFLSPVLFLTLPVLVWLIDGATAEGGNAASFRWGAALRAASAGWWFGLGYFLFGLFWVGEAFLVEAEKFAALLPFAVTLLPAGLALFTALAAGAARLAWPAGAARILVLAVALAAAEWLRGHVLTGFPWNLLGYALTWPLPLMQSAALVGVYGLTLLAVPIFAAPLVLIADAGAGGARRRALVSGLGASVAALLALYGYGAWRLSGEPAPMLEGPRLRIVQASVPQRDKWRPDKQRQIFEDQLGLSRHDAAGRRDDLSATTHLIWPEAAMPFLPLEHPEALDAIGDLLPEGVRLIAGALRLKRDAEGVRTGYNSLMVFSDAGRLETVYDKIHLVPFGEYLPFQATLEWLGLEQLTRWRGGFASGPEPRPLLRVPGLPALTGLICYEAIFPAAIVQGSERPGLLVNVTNDGWFGDTTGPSQHFHQARVRAVEEGLPLVRAANNGISAVIDGHGRVLARLGLNARGVIDTGVPAALPPPPYARLGDWLFLALVSLFAAAALALAARKTV